MGTVTPTGLLRVRLLPDKTTENRVQRWNPETGETYLTDPGTWRREDPSTWVDKPWPLLGMAVIGDPPAACNVSTAFVERGIAGGWIELEGEHIVHRPGGPADRQWKVTHTFTHADALVLKTVDGDVRYRVVHQPDKYAHHDSADDDTPVLPEDYAAGATRVDHFYGLELVEG